MAKSRSTARTPAAAPASTPTVRELTPEEIAALVASWDAARTELQEAGDAVAQLQAEYDAADDNADTLELAGKVTAARERVAAVETTIKALTPLPEGVTLPAARPAEVEIPAVSQVGEKAQLAADLANQGTGGDAGNDTAPEADVVASTSETHTTQSEDRGEGGAGNSASPAVEGRTREDLDRQADAMRDAFNDQIEDARFMAADGRGQAAVAFLHEQRAEVSLMITLAAEFAATIDAEIIALSAEFNVPVLSTVTVSASVPSRWRIGREFGREAITFEPGKLTADQLAVLKSDPLLSVSEEPAG